MLDLKFIRQYPEQVVKGAAEKKQPVDVERILTLDQQRRELQTKLDPLLAQKNALSERINDSRKQKIDPHTLIQQSQNLSIKISQKKKEFTEIDKHLKRLLLSVPNLPQVDVPRGTENQVIREWGQPRESDFELLPYWELAEKLGLINYAASGRMTGGFFPGLVGAGARLERALINFMLDLHGKEHGYTEISPPLLAKRETLVGTGQIPKMENEMYHLPQDDFFLIPTAEVPLTGWHQNEILEETSLPRKYTAGTPCFRREAGTYGRENRGLIRLHQFEKVELMQLCTPAQAAIAFAKLLNHAERVLQLLELRYRVVRLAVAELSFASEKTIDLEVWAPASKRWLEVSSVSSFGTFQARRLNLRYRSTADGNVHFLHTLNGSGIALPRTIVALLENCQTDEKTIHVPAVLQPYLGSAVIR